MLFRELYLNFSKDNRCQGSVELILIVGGIIVIILLVVALYKSYVIELGDEINSGEVEALNGLIEQYLNLEYFRLYD